MSELFQTIHALSKIAVEMKREGFPVDEERRAYHRERLSATRSAAEEKFKSLVADTLAADGKSVEEFNLGSHKQIGHLFYNLLGLKPKKAYISKTSGEYGVPKSALRDCIIEGTGLIKQVASALITFREEDKYETTYVGDGYYLEDGHYGLKVFRRDKRVHFNWSPGAAETFRSTGDGQQVPKHVYDADGKIIRPGLRDQYVAPPGYVLLEADYAQQELKKVALYCGSKSLIHELTRENGDAHGMFTRAMFQIPDSVYDKKKHKGMRDMGKTLVFAVLIYGGKPETGWRQVAPKYPKLTVQFVEQAKEKAYAAIPEIPAYHNDQIKFAKKYGYTPLPNELYKIKWKFGPINGEAIGEPENSEIINKRIQTSCAIFMNRAMVRVHGALKKLDERCKILLQVHDALFVIAPEHLRDKAAKIMRENMEEEEEWLGNRMFYNVDIQTGTCWGALTPWTG